MLTGNEYVYMSTIYGTNEYNGYLNDLDDDFLYEILHSCLYHPQDDYYTAYVDGLEYEIWVE